MADMQEILNLIWEVSEPKELPHPVDQFMLSLKEGVQVHCPKGPVSIRQGEIVLTPSLFEEHKELLWKLRCAVAQRRVFRPRDLT